MTVRKKVQIDLDNDPVWRAQLTDAIAKLTRRLEMLKSHAFVAKRVRVKRHRRPAYVVESHWRTILVPVVKEARK